MKQYLLILTPISIVITASLLIGMSLLASGPKYSQKEMFLLRPCKSVLDLSLVPLVIRKIPNTPFNSPILNPRITDISFPLFALSDGHVILKKRTPLKVNQPLAKK